MTRGGVIALALALSGCGYRLAGGASDPLGPFVVAGGEARTPYAEVMAAAEEGARAELIRQGAHGEGSALVVEILRVDEQSEAIARAPSRAEPLARALRIVVTGRAFVRRGEATARDTGDLRAVEVIARMESPTQAIVAREEAARRAARRLGELLARRVLGYPEPGDF